jgi:hypothetical protein
VRQSHLLLSIVAISLPLVGQQVGDAQRNYTLNGAGSNSPSFVISTIGVPITNLAHNYATQTPNAPLVWAWSAGGQIGAVTTATNSIDLALSSLVFLLDFNNASTPLSAIAYTNGTGRFSLTHPTATGLAGSSWFMAFAHGDAASPDGFYCSQVHQTNFVTDPSLSLAVLNCMPGTPVPLTDDSFAAVTLGFPFNYYGVPYSTAFVGSNGYVTFNTGDVILTETVAGFLSGVPRISMSWDDFNPAAGGSVTFFTDNVGTFQVCYTGVPEFGVAGSSNTFHVTAVNGTSIVFDFSNAMTNMDCLTGLSPGGGLATGLPVNLSVGVAAIPVNQAAYELFAVGATAFDLRGYQVTWLLDSAGVPQLVF